MSLTNDQITAQNFKDFYEGIRPYLNGQAPTFANAFNRSDLYSTDEKIVGCWIDGKPLYQKAFHGTWTLSASGDPSVLSDVTITNGEHLVSVELIQESSTLGDNYIAQVVVAGINQQYNLRLKPTNNITASTIVVKYTKTTDTAIKVGDGNDYSTDEQIIGTWIDGKPVYQKTVNGSVSLTDGQWANTSMSASGIDRVINFVANTDAGVFSSLYVSYDSYIQLLSIGRSVTISSFTIRYTKTTD